MHTNFINLESPQNGTGTQHKNVINQTVVVSLILNYCNQFYILLKALKNSVTLTIQPQQATAVADEKKSLFQSCLRSDKSPFFF